MLCIRVDLASGTMLRLAGVPSMQGHAGDAAAAASAQLSSPFGLTLNRVGRKLYIADAGNHAVRLLNLVTGKLSTVAGVLGHWGDSGDEGLGIQALLHSPYDVELDVAANQLYVADTNNHAIRKLDLATGILWTVAGILSSPGHEGDGDPGTLAQLYFPYGVTVASTARQLFIADNWNHAVRRLDLDTGLLTTSMGMLGSHGHSGDSGRADWSRLQAPMGITVDTEGRQLFVADAHNHAVRRMMLVNDVRLMSSFCCLAAPLQQTATTEDKYYRSSDHWSR